MERATTHGEIMTRPLWTPKIQAHWEEEYERLLEVGDIARSVLTTSEITVP